MLDPLSVSIPLSSPTASTESAPTPVRRLLRPSETHPDDYVMEIDYSAMSDFMCCPREFENRYVRSREGQKDRVAQDFGTLFHKLEDTRLRGGDGVYLEQTNRIQEHFLQRPPPAGDHRTADRMVDIITKYNAINGKDMWEKKVYRDENGPFIERPFKVELITMEVNEDIPYYPEALLSLDWVDPNKVLKVRNIHILYTGRIDAILEESDNLWVVDHKTSSRGGRDFEEAFRLSLQTRGYCWAVQKITGRSVLGLLMNAVIVRPLTKTGTGTEFNRHNYFYSADSLSEWEDNAKAICSDIVANLSRGFFPQHSRSFISPCARCDFAENCALPRPQRGADLASDLYRDVTWNPMLE